MVTAGAGGVLRRATRGVDVVTTISDFTERTLAPHLGAARLRRLAPGVDVERFRPDVDGSRLRTSWGVPPDALVVGCVSRLVPRKGQDALLAAWPRIHRSHPEAWLVLVGDGPSRHALRRRVRSGGERQVVLPGAVDWDRLPEVHAAFDVFAMPCRSRLGGLDVEGLGIVYLEAQASGVPVVAGRSGGAPEAVRDGVSGTVVDGRRPGEVADAVARWLADPAARAAAGDAGRRWVCHRWDWGVIAEEFAAILTDAVERAGEDDRG
jgi:phosphatidyl-myo-inositol dimannoside synthase